MDPFKATPPIIPRPTAAPQPTEKTHSSASGFGTFLLIVAVILFVIGLKQTQPDRLEEIQKRVVSASEEGRDHDDAFSKITGHRSGDFDRSYAESKAELEKIQSERNQRMLLFFGGAAVCFITGVICKKS